MLDHDHHSDGVVDVRFINDFLAGPVVCLTNDRGDSKAWRLEAIGLEEDEILKAYSALYDKTNAPRENKRNHMLILVGWLINAIGEEWYDTELLPCICEMGGLDGYLESRGEWL